MVKTLRKTNKKGFTLVELVIVIAILAILAAIAIPTVSNVISTANKNVDMANAQTVELALKTAQAEIEAGTAPSGLEADDPVSEVLTAYGINAIKLDPDDPTTGKSGATWVYGNKQVFCDSSHTTASGSGYTALKSSTPLSTVLP